ncbi:LuxR C-terminal-related transcriptional regulator [Cellulosimicrobium sp. KWT-B]|uniref:helix-turn-helix transcriptional regulator n=1 Tax=Cellulosimicrobium sp. KWT-B TaxID=1981152 RepID=UPI000A31ECFD|nr:LuxR C-terminal-related transcriptional regulator [Cellulosimicrobium sp. KWT-B]
MSAPGPRASLVDTVLGAVREGTSVVVSGLPGSGRSTLLARVRAAVLDDDRHVLSLAGVGPGAPRPLESLVLAGVLDAAPGQPVSLGRAVDAVERALGTGPAVLLVDDADALDDTSAAVLGAVSARRAALAVLSQRPPYPAPAVETVLDGRPTTVLPMPPLAFEEIHATASALLGGDLDAGVAGRLYGLSGGLPGLVRSVATEARRAGRLVEESGTWVARRDLVTSALAGDVGRLISGLSAEEVDGVWALAATGAAELATVHRFLPWPVLVALDDHGLVRFVETEGRTTVTLYPPLVGDLLRQSGGARALRAAEQVADALGSGRADEWDPLARTVDAAVPTGWAASRESAAILGRALRRHAAAQLLASRDAWERTPTTRNTVRYLEALVNDDASPDVVERVLARAHDLVPEEPGRGSFLVAWEAVYRAVVRHERDAALALLEPAGTTEADDAVLVAVAQHVLLAVGDVAGSGPSAEPPPPLPRPAADESAEPPSTASLLVGPGDVVGLVRAEVLLARGRCDDASEVLDDLVVPQAADRQDGASWRSFTLLCAGDVEAAVERSRRLLDQARDRFAVWEIEPHGYVIALGLYLQGRFTTLREHLTSVFAAGAHAPLRPSTRAGLRCLGAELSLREGNVTSARSLAHQLDALQLLAASTPLARPHPLAAELALATGQAGPEAATRAAWELVEAMDRRGYLLAALFDAAWLVTLWPDARRARRVAEHAAAAQGTLLPALGRYVAAAADRSPEALLAAADDLRARGLVLHGTQAHATAVRLLRDDGRTALATDEAHRLHALVATAGEELGLLVPPVAPVDTLSPREREVARLVARGLSNKDVARELVLSDRTVDNHVYRIFRKLGITSRDQLPSVL